MNRGTPLFVLIPLLLILGWMVRADEGLHTVTEPGGGEIVYGPLQDFGSQRDALVYMLREIHGHFGERPEVGRLFTAQGQESIAAFFNVHDTQHANRALAGMVIVVTPPGRTARAAVLTDDAAHFSKSLNPMLNRVNSLMAGGAAGDANRAASGANGAGNDANGAASDRQAPPTSEAEQASIPTLHHTEFPDGSGSLGLPQGWKIVAAFSGGVVSAGPRGELVVLGRYVPVIDTRNPMAAQRVAMMTRGGRVPLPGSYVASPYNPDPVSAFEAVANALSRKSGQNPISLTVKARQPQGAGVVVRGVIHSAAAEDKDSIIGIGVSPPSAMGNWGIMVTQLSVPISLSSQEMPTLIAISKTYQANGQRIAQETQATIGRIHAIGAAVTARVNAAHAQEEVQKAGFEHHMDDIDRNGAGFSNYLLDQTVVATSDNRYHGTFDNKTAQAIVESNPQQFQYVPTSGYIKGADY